MQKSQVFMLPIKVKLFALPPFQPELQPLSLVVASHPPRPARLHTTHHCDQSLLYPVSFLDSPCLILLILIRFQDEPKYGGVGEEIRRGSDISELGWPAQCVDDGGGGSRVSGPMAGASQGRGHACGVSFAGGVGGATGQDSEGVGDGWVAGPGW